MRSDSCPSREPRVRVLRTAAALAVAAALLVFSAASARAQCCVCQGCGAGFCVDALDNALACAQLCEDNGCPNQVFQVDDTCDGGCDGQPNLPTATPSGTLLSTPTGTPTATGIPTGTATATVTPSETPLDTPTASPTFTATGTPTGTAAATATATATDTADSATATATATAAATATPTTVAPATATPSHTATVLTASPTSTSTGTPTGTAAATATDTPTETPTGTPTGTAAATVTSTATATNTLGTVTATPTFTATGTPTGTAAATFTSTPSNTPTASTTPTPTGGFIRIQVGTAVGQPGSIVGFAVTLELVDRFQIVATHNSIAINPAVPFARLEEGGPDCTVNPALQKPDSSFSFLPTGCEPGDDCENVDAIVSGPAASPIIPVDSVLYTCRIAIPEDAEDGTYPLGCTGLSATNVEGASVRSECAAGEVIVQTNLTGDCNGDGMVAINELIVGVNIALGSQPIANCPAFDTDGSGGVSVNELIQAVNNALAT